MNRKKPSSFLQTLLLSNFSIFHQNSSQVEYYTLTTKQFIYDFCEKVPKKLKKKKKLNIRQSSFSKKN